MHPTDRFGRTYPPDDYAKMQAIGLQLEEYGYIEYISDKPNLFSHRYKGITFYVDLRSAHAHSLSPAIVGTFWWMAAPYARDFKVVMRRAHIEAHRLADIPIVLSERCMIPGLDENSQVLLEHFEARKKAIIEGNQVLRARRALVSQLPHAHPHFPSSNKSWGASR